MAGGKPNCGKWDFESNTPEGWVFDSTGVANWAGMGSPTASTTTAATGTRSLAVTFRGTGSSPMVFIRVPLCANGQALDLSNKMFYAAIRLVGPLPLNTGQGHEVQLYSGNSRTGAFGGNLSVNNETGGGATSGTWHYITEDFNGAFGADSVTHVGLRLLLNDPWTGTIYLDDIQIR